ncbi:MAG TPA: hypothetical protein PKN75_00030 [Bacteroidia bacterium]|nr:hypothetical protein [Bacteroidia bacterium]HNU31957.1 hypothetical protein [Bacteroidia bacterium]
MKKFLTTFLFLLLSGLVCSQDYFLPLNREWNLRYEPWLNSVESKAHTSFRPYRTVEIKTIAPFDSLNQNNYLKDGKFHRTLIGRKLLKENLFVIKEDGVTIRFNPLFELSGGTETEENKTVFTNTRGVWIDGTIGERFSFSTTFRENQAQLPFYLDAFTRKYKVVPNDGRVKDLYSNFDYANVSGTISFSLKKHFNFQLGHDKNFIGDGYRSLLLSDNAYSYPFFKISTTFWKIKYVNLYTLLQDLQIPAPDDSRFKRKYGTFHYLDINIGKRFSFGVMEAVIWKADSIKGRSFDFNYANPIIFIRPVEFSIGSPDNMMLGLNLKYKLTSNITLYGQAMLDEFKISEVRSGDGWWGNKQAFQAGVKTADLLVENLHLQTEINYVRPFTYSHRSSLTNYAHFNQSLAHPLGSNFIESVSIINYNYKNYFLRAQLNYTILGADTGQSNLGSDIFKSYDTYSFEYGNKITQGLEYTLMFADVRLGYLVNPNYNFVVEGGVIMRDDKPENADSFKTMMITFGIRTGITNRYLDF